MAYMQLLELSWDFCMVEPVAWPCSLIPCLVPGIWPGVLGNPMQLSQACTAPHPVMPAKLQKLYIVAGSGARPLAPSHLAPAVYSSDPVLGAAGLFPFSATKCISQDLARVVCSHGALPAMGHRRLEDPTFAAAAAATGRGCAP